MYDMHTQALASTVKCTHFSLLTQQILLHVNLSYIPGMGVLEKQGITESRFPQEGNFFYSLHVHVCSHSGMKETVAHS